MAAITACDAVMDVEMKIPSTKPDPAAPAYQFGGMSTFTFGSSSSTSSTTSSTSSPLSSPLTNMSRSPSPPSGFFDYPSPMSSQLSSAPPSSSASPAPESREDESTPPAKRRRTSYEPKPRVTQHLDFSTSEVAADQTEALERLMKAIRTRRKIVVIAGAGISVSAGIPDFRSSKGLFNSLKKQHGLKSSGKDLFDASVYKDDNSTTSFHQMVRELSNMTKDAKATPFHHLLATLADEGRLLRLYSQNVDGIDTSMPPLQTTVPLNRKGPWPKTIQVHGGLQKMVCWKCNDMQDLDADLFDGPAPPTCSICVAADNARTEHAGKRSHGVGRLRPRMVLYNEHNPDDEAIGAVMKADMRTRPDCLLVVGTTLKIPGVKRIVKEMSGIIQGRRDGLTVWANMDGPPPSKDYEWDIIVKGPCDKIAHHASLRKWYEPRPETVSEEQAKAIIAQTAVTVVVPPPTPQKTSDVEKALLTPVSGRSTPVPQSKKAETKLKLMLDGKPAKEKKAKNPPKEKKQVKGVKFVKKAVNKQTPSTQKLNFGVSKAGKKAAGKLDKVDKKDGGKVKVEAFLPAPMRPISPVDVQVNALTGIYNDQHPSPPFSPITPHHKRIELINDDALKPPKLSIEYMLNN